MDVAAGHRLPRSHFHDHRMRRRRPSSADTRLRSGRGRIVAEEAEREVWRGIEIQERF